MEVGLLTGAGAEVVNALALDVAGARVVWPRAIADSGGRELSGIAVLACIPLLDNRVSAAKAARTTDALPTRLTGNSRSTCELAIVRR